MRGKFFLVLFIAIVTITGIQPAFAQSGNDVPAKQPDKEGETVININLASDNEFIQALETATDIELVNEETAKNAKNASSENKGKTK